MIGPLFNRFLDGPGRHEVRKIREGKESASLPPGARLEPVGRIRGGRRRGSIGAVLGSL